LAFIQVRGLSKSFSTPKGVRHVLRDVSLDVDHGKFVSIVGAMGSGKSTLLSLLAGLTMPDGGEVTIGGEPTRGVRRDAASSSRTTRSSRGSRRSRTCAWPWRPRSRG
jgi:ABC-type nitrate/sulfonate/bicarbonate transport system ATPase subunit